LEPGKSAEDFLSSAVHQEAVSEVAPHYYRRIRIHRLALTTDNVVVFQRTLVKEFWMGEVSFRAVFTHPLQDDWPPS
jgi:hypothetical protein